MVTGCWSWGLLWGSWWSWWTWIELFSVGFFFKAAVSMTSAYWRGQCTWSFIRSSNLCFFPRSGSTASYTSSPGSALKMIPSRPWNRSRATGHISILQGSCLGVLTIPHAAPERWSFYENPHPWAFTCFSLVVLAFSFQLRGHLIGVVYPMPPFPQRLSPMQVSVLCSFHYSLELEIILHCLPYLEGKLH